jgi:hypothetical protein
MLRVYLDQNKWIEIDRVLTARTASEVVTMIYGAVERGYASFPLSAGHVFETWKAASGERRHALAPAMAAISMNHTIAAPAKLLPAELDHALQRRFGRPLSPLPIVPFGWGLAHGLGQPLPQISEETRAMLREDFPTMSEQELTALIEMVLLAGPPEDLPVEGTAQPPLQFAEEFAADENAQAELYAQHGADRIFDAEPFPPAT